MKKETSVFTVFFICVVLTFSAASVRAEAISTSTAVIDWGSLDITGDITWEFKVSESVVYVEDATGPDEDEDYYNGLDWVDTNAFASVPNAYGDAYTDNDYLYEEVYAIANETTSLWAFSGALAHRMGGFTALADGFVTISVDYELSQDLSTDNTGEWARGLARAVLELKNWSLNDGDGDMASLENYVSDGGSMYGLEDSGTLTASVWFGEGHYGEFGAYVLNEADVETPEPATIALLGLGALSLLRRKHRT
jgi:hypothetical protein